jgi:hypothetical protein
MWSLDFLVLLELSLNLILLGMIATIQFVHYPLFKYVPESARYEYHQAHMRAISPLVIPLMISELVLIIVLSILKTEAFVLTRLFLLLIVWASTFLVQVPVHEKITFNSKNAQLINQLVKSNWIRTLAWFFKALLGFILYRGMITG